MVTLMHELRPAEVRHAVEGVLLSDYVYEQLLLRIVTGELKAGENIRLDDLASFFEVSRTPLREGITKLASMGFIVTSRNSFTRIAEWGFDAISDRVEIVASLLGLALGTPQLRLSEALRGALRSFDVEAFAARERSIRALRETNSPLTLPPPVSDVEAFLCIATQVLDSSGRQVLAQTARDAMLPIRFFYTEAAEHRFNLDIAATSTSRIAAINTLAAAIAAGETRAAISALGEYESQLRAATHARSGPLYRL